MAAAAAHGIDMIDLVVVNLYPFEQTVAKPDVSFELAIENIDTAARQCCAQRPRIMRRSRSWSMRRIMTVSWRRWTTRRHRPRCVASCRNNEPQPTMQQLPAISRGSLPVSRICRHLRTDRTADRVATGTEPALWREPAPAGSAVWQLLRLL